MKLDKQFVLDELRKEGQSEKVQEAMQKLPDEIDRLIRRDIRNSADLYADLRDLQTHPDVEGA